jgi:hypothetical protein
VRIDEFFNFDNKSPRKKSPDEQRARNKPRDVLGNRPAAKEGPTRNFTNKDVARGYKELLKPNPKIRDPDYHESNKRMKKGYGVGTGPVGKLPENQDKENGMMDLKKMFEMAGVDVTQGKAKKLMEQDEFDFGGSAIFFDDAGNQVGRTDIDKGRRLMAAAQQTTDVDQQSVDEVLDYYDTSDDTITQGGGQPTSGDDGFRRFLANLEGFDGVVVYTIHGPAAGLPRNTYHVVIVPQQQ